MKKKNGKKKDFFISYTSSDEKQAVWIAEVLEKANYTTIIQAWDFTPGKNFINEMDKGLRNSKHLIAVWSDAYFKSAFCKAEWTAAFVNYATNKRAIIPVRISNVKPKGLLAPIIYIDLYNVDEDKRADVLLQKIQPGRHIGENSINPNISGIERGSMPFNNLPHSENPYFTGRIDSLNLIYENFKSGDSVALVQSVNGLGGIGKTSIALQYAYKYSNEYETIWWVNAREFDTTLSSMMKFALSKKIISEDAKSDDVIEEMKYWFSNNENWLFIYDNADADDFSEWLESFLPKSRNGHVLITTRSSFFPKCESIAITVFNKAEAVSFMKNRTRKTGQGYGDDLAEKLSERLQYLPLALEQAAAYIVETPGVTYEDYCSLIDEYGIDIFSKKKHT